MKIPIVVKISPDIDENQINLISQNTQKSEEINKKTLELENKLSKELSEIDQQINGYKKEIYKMRFSGLLNSMLGRKSWYRPKV